MTSKKLQALACDFVAGKRHAVVLIPYIYTLDNIFHAVKACLIVAKPLTALDFRLQMEI
tara:strand:+ start:533 stop:709 length:177 start_codon:yes stop_codon:yes gene_type:complete